MQPALQLRNDGILKLPDGRFLIPKRRQEEFPNAWGSGEDVYFGDRSKPTIDRVFTGRATTVDPSKLDPPKEDFPQ